jgi:hypothetical protein
MRATFSPGIRGLAVALLMFVFGTVYAASSLKNWREGPVRSFLTTEQFREFAVPLPPGLRREDR